MNDKNDSNFAFLSDDENDAFEEVPFEETPTSSNEPSAETSASSTAASSQGNQSTPVGSMESPKPGADTAAAEEAEKRAAHEAAEPQRKAEFEARKAQKKKAEVEQIAKAQAMSDEEVTAAAIQRASVDMEKLTRRNMKEMITEHIQTLCIEDPGFARLTMHPRKNMVRCIQYIYRKAFEYVQDEMKASGITPQPGMQTYGADIPEDLCYQWAEDYFRDPTVKEDEEKEEEFVAKPYRGSVAKPSAKKPSTKKKDENKPDAKKPEAKKPEPKKTAENDQLSFGQLSMI